MLRRLRPQGLFTCLMLAFWLCLAAAQGWGDEGRKTAGTRASSLATKGRFEGVKGRLAFAAEAAEEVQHSRQDYEDLTPEQKARLQRKLRKWESLPPEKQKALRHRMERWREMPAEERNLYKRRFDQWQTLPPEERREIRKKLKNWNALPPEEQERIRHMFQSP